MKLVTKSTDVSYLHILKNLLEANGIPAVVNGENTARMITPFALTAPSLWVYLDHQLGEAVKLVNDPDYWVLDKVDVDEFYAETSKITESPTSLNKVFIHLCMTMAFIILGMLALIKVLQWFARG